MEHCAYCGKEIDLNRKHVQITKNEKPIDQFACDEGCGYKYTKNLNPGGYTFFIPENE